MQRRMRKWVLRNRCAVAAATVVCLLLWAAGALYFYIRPEGAGRSIWAVVLGVGTPFAVVTATLCFGAAVRENRRVGYLCECYRSMAYTDCLTGMANRYAFLEHVKRLEQRSAGLRDIALVNIDVNDFKRINDVHGHLGGDAAVKLIAESLQDGFCSMGTCYRMGGDEFCMIAEGQARDKLENAVVEINRKLVDYGMEPPLSFSYGISVYDEKQHGGITELMYEADRLMYEQKARRRASVTLS